MKQPKKILVQDTLNESCDFDGMSADQMISLLKSYQEKYDSIYFRVNYTYDGNDFELIGEREETDAEFKLRIDKEFKAKEKARIALEKKRAKVEKEARKLGLIP